MERSQIFVLKFAHLWLIFVFILICCAKKQSIENGSDSSLSDEMSNKSNVGFQEDSAKQKMLIQGLWATSRDANASFRVSGDSLFFFEDPVPVFFEIKADSFIYYLDGEKFANKILKLDSDSIVFIENGELVKLYNRDKK